MNLFVTATAESFKMCWDPIFMLLLFGGVIWGAIVGALPGVGATLGVGILLPFTFQMSPVYAIGLFMSINVANSFGNSIPAILLGVPGSPSATLTSIDGYALHKQGKSGLALGVTYFSSVFAQFISIFFFLAMVVPLSGLTYVFLTPEMAALYFLGMTTVISISGDNILKGLLAAAFGLAISLIGRDPVSAVTRFAFVNELREGIDVVPVTLGLLAMSELFRSMRQSFKWEELTGGKLIAKFPSVKDFVRIMPRVMIGTFIGSTLGAIPGLSGTAAAFISYEQSRLWSKHPEEYGKGSIEGVAANEAAQNASQAGECVPTFGLGIAASGSMVMILAACLMHGFVPGPQMIRKTPELLYAASGGMMASTLWLAVIGWPMSIYTLKLMTLDRQLVLISCVAITMVGTFTLNYSTFDIFVLLLFGVVGYFMRRYGFPVAGTAIAVILGSGLESNLRGGLVLENGDWWAFLTRPWTAIILSVAFGLLIYASIGTIKLARRAAAIRQQAMQAHLASLSTPNKKPGA
jgi:putative tricarboxylic transport membrane protein